MNVIYSWYLLFVLYLSDAPVVHKLPEVSLNSHTYGKLVWRSEQVLRKCVCVCVLKIAEKNADS